MAEKFEASTVTARLNTWLIDSISASVGKLQQRLEEVALQMEKDFFKDLVAKCVAKTKSPTLAEFSPNWVKLSKKYVRWKVKRGGFSGFYKTGVAQYSPKQPVHTPLKTILSGLDAVTVLGKPIAVYQARTALGKVSVRAATVRGRAQARVIAGSLNTKGKKSGGQFASAKDIFAIIPEHISLQPFSRVETYNHIEELIFDEGSREFFKITGRDAYYRPLVAPFMKYWAKYRLAPTLDKAMEGV